MCGIAAVHHFAAVCAFAAATGSVQFILPLSHRSDATGAYQSGDIGRRTPWARPEAQNPCDGRRRAANQVDTRRVGSAPWQTVSGELAMFPSWDELKAATKGEKDGAPGYPALQVLVHLIQETDRTANARVFT
jgi:hypothetical protein